MKSCMSSVNITKNVHKMYWDKSNEMHVSGMFINYSPKSLVFMNYRRCIYLGAVIVLLFVSDRYGFSLSCSLCSRRALGFGERCKYVLNVLCSELSQSLFALVFICMVMA